MHITEFSITNPCICSEGVYTTRPANDPPSHTELKVAMALQEFFKVSILFLPRRHIFRAKNPDILLGNVFAEIKHSTGSLKTIGSRFRDATKQAQTIVLWIENPDITTESLYTKISGEISDMKRKGKFQERQPKSLIINLNGVFHLWDLQKISPLGFRATGG